MPLKFSSSASSVLLIFVILIYHHSGIRLSLAEEIIIEKGTGDEDSRLLLRELPSKDGNARLFQLMLGKSLVVQAQSTRTINNTGWNILEIRTDPDISDENQAYHAGFIEGYAEADLIYEHYINTQRDTCINGNKTCLRVKQYLWENKEWASEKIKKETASSFWHQVGLFYRQVQGVHDGAKMRGVNIDYIDILMMNVAGDLYDLFPKFNSLEGMPRKLVEEGGCSAIVKLLPENRDLLVAHNSWFNYNKMNRMQKRYHLSYRLHKDTNERVPSRTVTFSGYPGVIQSFDDFYLLSEKIVVQETTIGNTNKELWKHVTANATVLESARVMAANRLAKDGQTWCETFSQFNSGTYNNQWMVVDYKRFHEGKEPEKGLLWILEQIPGHIMYKEKTSYLKRKTYWPSYNIPYYKDIFKLNGQQEMVDKYGSWFSYNGSPRAKIFKRDQHKIKDLDTLMDFMRYNDFKNDPLSACDKCKPPYSASFAIAARKDLNAENGSYPFPFVGHAAYGAIDAKMVDSQLVHKSEFIAVAGPSPGRNLVPFTWSKSPFESIVTHLGMPDEYNFKPVQTKWEWY